MFKIGIVKNIDAINYKVRVEFPELDNMLSSWLPVGTPFAKMNKAYGLPSVDELVCCVMDENFEDGVVICSLYNSEDTVPVSDPDLFRVDFADGTYIEYDKSQHKLTADIQGSADIIADTGITILSPITNITGNLAVAGAISATSTVTASNVISGGKSVNGHVHGGVMSGGSDTGAF